MGKEGKLRRYPISKWVESVKKKKGKPDFDPLKNSYTTHKFSSVDITGNTAAAKVKIYKKGKLVYTDYLSLYKYDNQWKICL